MTRIDIVGCYHMNRRSVVAEAIDRAGGTGPIAVEFPRVDDSDAFKEGLARAPLVFFGAMVVDLLVQAPLIAILVRDVLSAETSVALEQDRRVTFVDHHLMFVLADRSLAWMLPNWLGMVVWMMVAPKVIIGIAILGFIKSWLVRGRRNRGGRQFAALGSLGLSATAWWLVLSIPQGLITAGIAGFWTTLIVYLTVGDRNRAMLSNCQELADDTDADRICLLTGNAHLPGLLDRIDSDSFWTVGTVVVQRFLRDAVERTPEEIVRNSR